MEKKDNKFWSEIAKLFRLETMTTAGRYNLGSMVVLAIFVIAYTASDKFCYFISAVRDAYKTTILKQNISDPYQTTSIFKLFIPVIILIIFCFYFLYKNEKEKQKFDKT